MKLKLCRSVPLEMPFHMVSFLAEVKMFRFGQKPWTIIRRFDQIEVIVCGPFTLHWKVL